MLPPRVMEFRILGPVDLRTDAGEPVASVLAQPKRIALLAYLVLRGGYQPRETLVGLFWPELSEERARAALRQAVYQLRQALGTDVVSGRGAGELCASAERLWCDAVAFDRAVRAAELDAALDLYRGELLSGFYVARAPAFERWLETERARLRTMAADAAWALAEAAEDHDPVRAQRYGSRALALSAGDEPSLRRLMSLLDRIGDPAGAIHAYESFAQHVAEEAGAAPAEATQLLAERIRARRAEAAARSTTVVEPEAVVPPGPEAAAPTPLPDPVESAAAAAAPPRTGGSGRWRVGVIAGALALSLLAAALLFWNASRPGAPADDHRVAIFPFAVQGGTEVGYLDEGIVHLLSTNFQGAGRFRSVDPHALLSSTQGAERGSIGPARAQEIAARFGAGLFLLGNIAESDGRLRISAALYDQDSPGEPLVRATVAGEAAGLFELLDQLTAQLLAGRLRSGENLTPLRTVTTASLPALRAYLQGEQLFRSQQYPAAVSAFRRALAADSTFALAAYRLSVAADWVNDNTLSGEAAEHAAQLRTRLPEVDRLLVDGLVAFNLIAPAEAKRLYRSVLARQPHNVEAWYRLAEVEYHHNPLLGLDPALARPTFARVLALDPNHQPARTHLLRIAAELSDEQAFDTLARRALRDNPRDSLLWLHLRAFAFDDRELQARLAPVYETATDSLLWTLVQDVALYTRNFGAARDLARRLAASDRPRDLRVAGHLLGAWMETALGRPGAASGEIAEAARLDPAMAAPYRAILATLPFLPLPASELRAIRDSLATWGGSETGNPYLPAYTRMSSPTRQQTLGLLSARLGDTAAARRYAEGLYSPQSDPDLWGAQRAAAVRARLAALRGDPATALGLLEQERFAGVPDERFAAVNYFERHLRPGLLRALGRERQALGWYGAAPWRGSIFSEHVFWDWVYLAPFHLERGELLEKMGRPAEAAAHYGRFIELWSSAEPPLQPRVAEARRRLARLRS